MLLHCRAAIAEEDAAAGEVVEDADVDVDAVVTKDNLLLLQMRNLLLVVYVFFGDTILFVAVRHSCCNIAIECFAYFTNYQFFCKGKSTARQPRLDALFLFPFQLDSTTSKVLANGCGVQTWMLLSQVMWHFYRSYADRALYSVVSENGTVLGQVDA